MIILLGTGFKKKKKKSSTEMTGMLRVTRSLQLDAVCVFCLKESLSYNSLKFYFRQVTQLSQERREKGNEGGRGRGDRKGGIVEILRKQ